MFAVSGQSVLQARHLIFQQQLATFQLNDLKIVYRRVIPCFGYFRFQGPMLSFQFGKVRCCEHSVLLR